MSQRKVRITRMEVERTGVSNDRPWTLYTVECEAIDGEPLPSGPLKSFDALTGEEDVLIEPFVKDGAVQHHTLKPILRRHKRAVAGVRPLRDDNDPRIADLEARVEKLENRLTALIRSIDTPLEVTNPS
jgi:hypothetical protein